MKNLKEKIKNVFGMKALTVEIGMLILLGMYLLIETFRWVLYITSEWPFREAYEPVSLIGMIVALIIIAVVIIITIELYERKTKAPYITGTMTLSSVLLVTASLYTMSYGFPPFWLEPITLFFYFFYFSVPLFISINYYLKIKNSSLEEDENI